MPFMQRSLPVQPFPSEHSLPSGTGAWTHDPSAGAHVSMVQSLSSSHVLDVCSQPFVPQVSTVHGLWSSQSTWPSPVH
jgi:hypothetical protein